jgi:hypothetical protein
VKQEPKRVSSLPTHDENHESLKETTLINHSIAFPLQISSKKRKCEEEDKDKKENTLTIYESIPSRFPLQPRDNTFQPSHFNKPITSKSAITNSSQQQQQQQQQQRFVVPSNEVIEQFKPKAIPLIPLLGAIEVNPLKRSRKLEGINKTLSTHHLFYDYSHLISSDLIPFFFSFFLYLSLLFVFCFEERIL